MAEKSFLWTTGSVGDGTNTYTRADTSAFSQVLAAVHDDEGVAPGLLNALAGSVPGANTVRINTGGALVDGKPYLNDSTVDVNIPSAVGGGNTRIDRIVLRADWTAQTVRIHRIAGTDAASPTAPAITQNPGNVYDLPLYQALVDTAGAVTLIDERKLGQVGTTGLEDGAVTASKLGSQAVETTKIKDGAVTAGKIANDAVDDTKVGNRVPKVVRRSGGHANNWNIDGSTIYTPGGLFIQVGSAKSSSGSVVNVTFPVEFSATPLLFIQGGEHPEGQSFTLAITTITKSGFSGVLIHHASISAYHIGGSNQRFYWLAIGPE